MWRSRDASFLTLSLDTLVFRRNTNFDIDNRPANVTYRTYNQISVDLLFAPVGVTFSNITDAGSCCCFIGVLYNTLRSFKISTALSTMYAGNVWLITVSSFLVQRTVGSTSPRSLWRSHSELLSLSERSSEIDCLRAWGTRTWYVLSLSSLLFTLESFNITSSFLMTFMSTRNRFSNLVFALDLSIWERIWADVQTSYVTENVTIFFINVSA